MAYLRISTPGGVVTPDELQRLASVSHQWALGKMEVGFRQDLLIRCTDAQLPVLRQQLGGQGFSVEEAVPVHPNIVSSVVAQNIFPKVSWLRSGDYLDILDSFDVKPRFKINLIDPTQELIRPLTGEVNFIASPTPSFWYMAINLPVLGALKVWPELVDGEQIAEWVKTIENTLNAPGAIGSFEALFQSVTSRFKGRTRRVREELRLTSKPYPHHEGIYRYDERYWIGLYQRDNEFEASFIGALCQLCKDTKIGRLYPTPFKTFIVRDIPKETIYQWEKLLGLWGIPTHYSSLELNWQLPDADAAALRLKTELVDAFERTRIRTSSLSFSIGLRSADTTSTIVIEPLSSEYERFRIVHSPDFFIGNTDWETFAADVARKNLPEVLRRLTQKYYEQLSTEKKAGLTRTTATLKPIVTEKVMRCKHCLTVANRPAPLSSSYVCPTCDAPARDFVEVTWETLT
ncbi:rubredoxin-type Fe(Cys)4 protein [Runella slithyformis]|uniref:Rubredoxin-type Fe(Cys)4 protein n=1 Tax=Runella slithyformis (strain ATCC 29530 / DSM 19594 / LMG 11500 / NCIMB 11436 / LSU 4) TaxID=761193 RepID=A0A7U3ZKT0_RUNSL|nr:rubredoxin-type Fe(Cys)4 protein [Runella slithyformis]AEI48982.1 rubredoxin-type Fe(Cys)4 protein [Runella slithyformis DSM 19594]